MASCDLTHLPVRREVISFYFERNIFTILLASIQGNSFQLEVAHG
ncbi:hypothetical protein SGGMMB4_05900 (plasmid) [Sodalis glossinidius str. 'morsitans']|uniref:Uncharacterized protein n=1 Tax=Sodalis glossinidius (strain morsitans) TaxID=343509 RepID=A0A193QP71_SODGM|nr:hypothetical protein SGGMMB4_05900 [Sodalis glossinidius str. 'morsitans']